MELLGSWAESKAIKMAANKAGELKKESDNKKNK
jgi:hypothetical protein